METEGKIVVNQLPFGGSLRDWSAAEFGAILQRYLNCPLEQVYNSELDQVYTWLYNEDASQKVLDFDIMPIERRRPA